MKRRCQGVWLSVNSCLWEEGVAFCSHLHKLQPVLYSRDPNLSPSVNSLFVLTFLSSAKRLAFIVLEEYCIFFRWVMALAFQPEVKQKSWVPSKGIHHDTGLSIRPLFK